MPLSMLRTRSILNSNRDCGSYYEVFNRIEWRLKSLIGDLQYSLYSGNESTFSSLIRTFLVEKMKLTLHEFLQMWGNCGENKKIKIAKPLVFKGLAIVV